MVDTAIAAMADWAASGLNANSGGAFAAADACDALLERTRATVATLLGTTPDAVVLRRQHDDAHARLHRAPSPSRCARATGSSAPASTTTPTSPRGGWRARPVGPSTCSLRSTPGPVASTRRPSTDLIDERTRWVAVTGASNLLGTIPDLGPIVAAAHECGARVFVDAVHLAPHRRIDFDALGCDALVTSPYKWYGPHAGVLVARPELLDGLPVARVRPAAAHGPRRWETGTPSFEAIAAVDAAAQFLLAEGMDRIAAAEAAVFSPLLDGLVALHGVHGLGPEARDGRTPTVAFTITGKHPDEIATALAHDRIATWAGHSYAVEVVDQLGLADKGGVVRAGVVAYIDDSDVARLLDAVEKIAATR